MNTKPPKKEEIERNIGPAIHFARGRRYARTNRGNWIDQYGQVYDVDIHGKPGNIIKGAIGYANI